MHRLFDSPAAVANLQARLNRYARRHISSVALAEDAVSETLLAALERAREFESGSHAHAWLYGVLKHKLTDQLRDLHREVPCGDPLAEHEAPILSWSGAWTDHREPSAGPQAACEQRQFVELLRSHCQALPANQGRAFVMRELLDMDSDAVCRSLDISEGHLWVLIHRARARLGRELASYRCAAVGRSKQNVVA